VIYTVEEQIRTANTASWSKASKQISLIVRMRHCHTGKINERHEEEERRET
jgi:hypothetical protein